MNDGIGGVSASPRIAVYADGERYPAQLKRLTQNRAELLLERPAITSLGDVVSLLIGNLPSFPGDVVEIDGPVITIHFRLPLDQSVVEFADDAVVAAAHGSTNRPTKRATRRPPFPFDN